MSKQKCFPWLFYFYPSLWSFSQVLPSMPLTHIPHLTVYLTNHYLNSWSLKCILQPELFLQNEKSNYTVTNDLLITLKIKTSYRAIRSHHYLFCACITDLPLPPLPRTLKDPRQGCWLCSSHLLNTKVYAQRGLLRPLLNECALLSPHLTTYPIHWLIRDLPSFIVLSEFIFLISQVNYWVAMMTNLKSKSLPVILVKY